MAYEIRIKRIYEAPAEDDGARILIDRLWPRGMAKARAKLDGWWKDVTPSPELRTWFHKDLAGHYEEFGEKYTVELAARPEVQERLLERAELLTQGNVTFLYAAKDPVHNHARILQNWFQWQLKKA